MPPGGRATYGHLRGHVHLERVLLAKEHGSFDRIPQRSDVSLEIIIDEHHLGSSRHAAAGCLNVMANCFLNHAV